MDLQLWAVAIVVPLCAAHAAWALSGASARRFVAARLVRLPVPRWWRGRLQRHAAPAGGCGCDGCDHRAPTPASGAAVVRVHLRRR
ncbi:MAG: hypothetical protein U1E89_16520 [Burkholderiaceae bacterium]